MSVSIRYGFSVVVKTGRVILLSLLVYGIIQFLKPLTFLSELRPYIEVHRVNILSIRSQIFDRWCFDPPSTHSTTGSRLARMTNNGLCLNS